ncbi:hypothetical protein LZ496_10690 [Sphingomonas sp. NSE70-1]|uniref:Uncharacterized protein n=1 Tax=Sphingomonas caseinilyticus TaxID=2908205 RepID=A0ABT0RW28_9SPHN|nr:hypothetical protein [Sphingomonas caseinilyticus]MCL6699245.1 hypothetical protein [Sphingomonas caseinilyticus]
MINQRFVVQLDRHTVGVAVRVAGGFIFYASDDQFDEMDGRIFTRARAIERQLKKVASKQRDAGRWLRQSPMPA